MSILKPLALILPLLFIGYAVFGEPMERLPDDPTTEQAPIMIYSAPKPWPEPVPTLKAQARVLKGYAASGVPQNMLSKALLFYNANQAKITNHSYIGIVDFSAHSSGARFYIVSLKDKTATVIHVAHGSGSDVDNDGYATVFSNVSGSKQSSLGMYLTAETYTGKHGLSRRVDGLSTTNSNVRSRAIVIHASDYVVERTAQPGRSWGCFAVANEKMKWVLSVLPQGSLIYAGLSAKD